jgi:hypothetical protein
MKFEAGMQGKEESLEPIHEHDCKECIFLGHDTADENSTEEGKNMIDVYLHRDGKNPEWDTIIRRYGGQDSQYRSFAVYIAREIAQKPDRKGWERALKMYEERKKPN